MLAELHRDVPPKQLKLDEHSAALEAARHECVSAVEKSGAKIAVADDRFAKAEDSTTVKEKKLEEDVDFELVIETNPRRAALADLKQQQHDGFAAETKQVVDDHDFELKPNEMQNNYRAEVKERKSNVEAPTTRANRLRW